MYIAYKCNKKIHIDVFLFISTRTRHRREAGLFRVLVIKKMFNQVMSANQSDYEYDCRY